MPDPLPKPPGRPPGEPIIIKNQPRSSEVVEIDGSLDEDDDPEIKMPPDITPKASTTCTLGPGRSPFRQGFGCTAGYYAFESVPVESSYCEFNEFA
jgi:hypothetical protein